MISKNVVGAGCNFLGRRRLLLTLLVVPSRSRLFGPWSSFYINLFFVDFLLNFRTAFLKMRTSRCPKYKPTGSSLSVRRRGKFGDDDNQMALVMNLKTKTFCCVC